MHRNAHAAQARLRRAVLAAATLMLGAMACGGCAYVMPTTALSRESETQWYSNDLPVAEGFVIQKNLSLVNETGGQRTLRLTYKRESYIDMDRPWEFYQEAYKARGWELQFLYGFDKRGMVFWKGAEECRITIDRSLAQAFVVATVEIEPKDPTGAAPILAKRVD